MSAIKESLEASKDQILENLPAEFHADFEKEVEAAAGASASVASEDELAAIKAELTAHPDCDESVVGEIDPAAHRAAAPPTEEEQKAAIKDALGKVSELTAPEE